MTQQCYLGTQQLICFILFKQILSSDWLHSHVSTVYWICVDDPVKPIHSFDYNDWRDNALNDLMW